MGKNILIGGAWPYANGSLHIGHIAGLLPGDVLARYHRAAGDNVYFVSGSDCHGTPVAIRAKQENRTPREISDFYHGEFTDCFQRLGFSYDVYTKTSSAEHRNFVTEFHRKLYESEYIYEKEAPQAYCQGCGSSLADRFVLGRCPRCGKEARGDQCDVCGTVLEPEALVNPVCATCGKPIAFRSAKHLYIAISRLERQLQALVDAHPEWRKNAAAFTNRYIREGLRDRALTRDLEWGIPVPKAGYESKTIYIWAENVLGYLSASKTAAEERGADFSWREFVHSHNGELLGGYGNFVNRSLAFIEKYLDGTVPEGKADPEIHRQIGELYASVGRLIEKGSFKDALERIFDFVRSANKFFDARQPWIARTADRKACEDTLYQCVQIVGNLAVLLAPFLPFSSEKVCGWLGVTNRWEKQSVPAGHRLPEVEILFRRIDKAAIEEETEKLKAIL